MSKVIETDSRGRLSLKKLGIESHSHYRVSVLEGGTVLLEPVVFKTALETTLEAALPDIESTIASNRVEGYPTANDGKARLAAFLERE